jgi:hypothetical protein
MNKFIFSAIAIAAASSTGFAAGSDWLQLDQDIASLNTTMTSAEGVNVGGLLRNSYRDGGPIGGWAFEDADLFFGGALEEFSWRVSFDLASGSLALEDAYVTWGCTDDLSVMWGRFKAPALRSATVDPENMLFIDRSMLGATYDVRDNGVGIMGNYSGFGYTFAVQNGGDGTGDDNLLFAHVDYNIGNGVSAIEGAMKAGDEMDGTIGVTYMDMENDGVDAVLAADFAMTMGQLSGSIEYADGSDDDIAAGMGQSPWSLALGYLFADNMEVAWRYEDMDNTADDTTNTIGLNWYLHGHNAKWQFNYIDADAASDQIIAVGLTLGASR